MKIKKLLSIIAILFIALMTGCAKDDFVETIGVCPIVTTTNPINGASGVPLNQIITATFNETMNPATITASSFIITVGGAPVSGTVTLSGAVATFTPTSRLAANTVYTGRITTSAKDKTGNALQTDYIWTFTTGFLPLIVSTDPANLAIDVALNKVITATFNMSMDPLTLTATTFTVKQGATTVLGAITYSGTMVSFTPSSPLAENKVYTCTITTGAKNLAGIEIASDYVWTFTTGLLPIVVSTDPANNAIGVALNKIITATFNMPMNPLTLTDLTYTVKQGATAILGTISYSGSTVTFTPSSPLVGNKVYTCTITTGARNVAGTALANDYVWNFTTFNPVNANPPPVNTTNGLGFGAFGGNAGITNQGLHTVVNGSIGTTAASTLVTGFTDGTNGNVYTVTPLNNGLVTGGIYTAAPAPGTATNAATALAGLNAARTLYLSISPASMPGGVVNPGAGELGGLTLAPGIYTAASSFKVTNGNLTLDAQGDPNAKWYFQAPSSLTVGDSAPSSVVFLNGVGNPNNVYWYVGSSAVINYAGGGVMVGNIIANSGVTLSSPANSTSPVGQETVLNGRAISLVSAVTMVNTIINVP
ncbi:MULTISPECIES: Ig-like domain-containing protein [unclassified Flavobacterium]|jgi:hypothetical protein|uniref:Ig-like domain-containing protein n=1 Tax=unclassified Flavobacterium TaxID=196869 RepID=UPI0025BF697B|nr:MULTISPECIES: Ig-like domain-containing protein [unclassified Flavobacterium]